MERKSMHAAGKFRRQQVVDLLMPGDAVHAGKTGRNHGKPEMRIGCRATMHMAFVQHFEKRRFEFLAQFVFENSLHAIWHPVSGGAHYILKSVPPEGFQVPVLRIQDRFWPYRLASDELYQALNYRSNVMPISWYPGHMHKARKELGSLLRSARLVIEVLDARIPAASSNPLLASMRGDLPLVRVLNKCDLADDGLTSAWQSHFAGLQDGACLRNGRDSPLDRKQLLACIRRLGGAPGGKAGKTGRIAIVGIPNAGKSSLMNLCVGRKLARTGNTPSVTREQQSARFDADWTMVDTPGMLRPRLEDQRSAMLMASVGSIGAAAADTMEVAWFLAGLLLERHRERLDDRYGLEISDETPERLFDRIAVSRGALKKAGLADPKKAAEILLSDFRAARLGGITLEYPPNPESRQA